MIKPHDIEPDVWATLTSAEAGDSAALRRLIERDPSLARCEYWYTPAIHFAARGGHLEAVKVLLEARVKCAAMLLDAGASISARDEEYRSTPLAWAARNGVKDMVDFLLDRGAVTNLAGDEAWATPLSWAERRGHLEIAETLRRAGAW